MIQKIIKVGNSYAVTIPSLFVKELGLKQGQQLSVETNMEQGTIVVTKNLPQKANTPEVSEWLEKFNQKYKKGLAELAKK